MTRPVPIAVIGCGLIGLRHAQVAQDLPQVDLTAVVEPNATLAATLIAQGLPVVPDVDAVPRHTQGAIVATPTPDHAASGMAALNRGWAVLVEKPLAATLAKADHLIETAQTKGLPLVTGHHRRCQPFVRATPDHLARIGKPVAVQGMWSLRKHDDYYLPDWRRAPGAGPIMTNLSHEIDLLRLFMGEIVEVSALSSSAARGFVIEDTAALSFRFASGALGSFLISEAGASPWAFETASDENPYIAATGEDYLRFTGASGALAFPSLTTWTAHDACPPDWHHGLKRKDGADFDKIDPIRAQMAEFADLVAGRDTDLLATGADGRATLEMTLATILSAQTGRPVQTGQVDLNFNGIAAVETEWRGKDPQVTA